MNITKEQLKFLETQKISLDKIKKGRLHGTPQWYCSVGGTADPP